MEIEEIALDDIDELTGLQPEGWPNIIPNFNFYVHSSFCKPLKFCISQRIIGIGAVIFHKKSAWLGHIIVHPEYRNRGIGGLITQTLVDCVDLEKHQTINLIATEMGEPVYRKIGFKKITDYLFFKTEDTLGNRLLSKQVTAATATQADKILELDQLASGEDRSALLEEHIAHAKIYMEKGDILGLYMPTLGEGLIVAKEKNAGIELLKLSLRGKTTCVLPQENTHGVEYLLSQNFKLAKKAARMSIGRDLGFDPKMLYNRIAGNVG